MPSKTFLRTRRLRPFRERLSPSRQWWNGPEASTHISCHRTSKRGVVWMYSSTRIRVHRPRVPGSTSTPSTRGSIYSGPFFTSPWRFTLRTKRLVSRHHHGAFVYLRNPEVAAQVEQVQRPQGTVHADHAHIPVASRQHRQAAHVGSGKVQPKVRQRCAVLPIGIHKVLPACRTILPVNGCQRSRIVPRKIPRMERPHRNAVQPCDNPSRLRIRTREKSIRNLQHGAVKRKGRLRERTRHHRIEHRYVITTRNIRRRRRRHWCRWWWLRRCWNDPLHWRGWARSVTQHLRSGSHRERQCQR